MGNPQKMRHICQSCHPCLSLSRVATVLLLAGTLSAAAWLLPTVAMAQQPLSEQMERLRRDVSDLQKFVYRNPGESGTGQAATGQAATGQATAGSATGSGGLSSDLAARLQVKLQSLQDQMRSMTGRLEELEFNLRRSAESLDRLSGDLEFRLQRLEGGAAQGTQTALARPATSAIIADAGATTSATTLGGGNTSTTGTTTATTLATANDGVISQSGVDANSRIDTYQGDTLQPGQKLFGVLRTDGDGAVIAATPGETTAQANAQTGTVATDGSGTNATDPAASGPVDGINAAPVDASVAAVGTGAASSVLGGGAGEGNADLTPEERYAQAYTLLRKRDFAAAELALRDFLQRHGDHARAGNAIYWLGESYYARKNYRDAAATFVDAYTRYPKSPKASHSLLKLGMALSSLGKTDAACTALKTLREQYAEAEARVLKTAQAEMARAGCS